MSNPNFVSDLVAMAKAFEELPEVKAALEAKTHDFDVAQQMIQRLELRIMDLKNEVDTAHAATRKVEVERDHAERMFLETDDRLNAFRRLLAGFQTEAGALIAAAEPEPQPEPAQVTEALTVGAESAEHPTSSIGTSTNTSGSGDPAPADGPVLSSTEAVSVPSDPTSASVSSDVSAYSGSESSLPEPTSVIDPRVSAEDYYAKEDAAKPVDPTASSTAGDGHSFETATPDITAPSEADATTQASPTDDVGYHNEPQILGSDWTAWDTWADRMNAKFGRSTWPLRPTPNPA